MEIICLDGNKREVTDTSKEFYAKDISDELFDKIKGRSYSKDCTIPISDLKYIHILHKTLGKDSAEGELICHKAVFSDILSIFRELYENSYPIEKVRLIDEYEANDEMSMRDNNSSCFNFRFISYSNILSKHALGLAVDINPLYNPYIKTVDGRLSIEPSTAAEYSDREGSFPYKIEKDDLCVSLFARFGFEWGGNWSHAKDYQHFELSESIIKERNIKNK